MNLSVQISRLCVSSKFLQEEKVLEEERMILLEKIKTAIC